MMVPRAYAYHTSSRTLSNSFDEKRQAVVAQPPRTPQKQKRPSLSSLQLPQASQQQDAPKSQPVSIPNRSTTGSVASSARSTPVTSIQESETKWLREQPKRKESAHEILVATAIPIKRKPKVRSTQKLPDGDFVADFAKHLRDDVATNNARGISRSVSSSNIDGLFGSINELVEGQMFVGSEGLDGDILTTRSLSTESVVSLASPDDYSTSEFSNMPSSLNRSPTARRRQTARAEASPNHPLEQLEGVVEPKAPIPDLVFCPPPQPRRRPQFTNNGSSSFRSSLTASLKALKSAAQSVSTLATLSTTAHPDDFNYKALFEINPALTDDRRPPPSGEAPSAALRRYLNPSVSSSPDSPTQLHFWSEDKSIPHVNKSNSLVKPKSKSRRKYGKRDADASLQLPAVVPLATCIPSPVRGANATSPPRWLSPDGTPQNRQTGLLSFSGFLDGQTRPREPRENRDFLRMFVCQMNMRKAGKLSEDAPMRASLWLPPVQDNLGGNAGSEVKKRRIGIDRLQIWILDDD